MKQRQQGFTLIELMMVVSIIGILASLALPSYQAYVYRAKAAEVILVIDKINMVLSDLQAEEGATIGFPLGLSDRVSAQAGDTALEFCRRKGVACVDSKPVSGLDKSEFNRLKRLGFTVSVSSGTAATSMPGQYKIGLNVDHGAHTSPKLRAQAQQIALATEHVMKSATYRSTIQRDGSVGLYFQLGGK